MNLLHFLSTEYVQTVQWYTSHDVLATCQPRSMNVAERRRGWLRQIIHVVST